jgi:acyl-CoA thioesterase-2
MPMPLDVPAPEALLTQIELIEQYGKDLPEPIRRFWARDRPIEIRPVNVEHYASRDPLPPQQKVWMRFNGMKTTSRALNSAMLAYISDMTLLDTATFPHGRWGFEPDIQMASLDHAIWFHRPPSDMEDWFLYSQDTPSTMGARGFARGQIFTRDGTLIASVAQEGLVRVRTRPSA